MKFGTVLTVASKRALPLSARQVGESVEMLHPTLLQLLRIAAVHPRRPRANVASCFSIAALCIALAASPSAASKGDCGQPVTNGSKPTVTDALFVLRTAVGGVSCQPWICDVDSNGRITTGDALRVLRLAVGQVVTILCPPEVTTTTTTTTTTTMAPLVDLECNASEASLTFKTASSESSADFAAQITLRCGDPASGGGPCTCLLDQIDPIFLEGVGVVCVTQTDQCDGGSLDCDGGAPRETTLSSDHDIGTCNGNANCAAMCQTHCQGLGATAMSSGCEGYCGGGSNVDQSCTGAAQCPGSFCNGKVASHGKRCACHCSQQTGSAASAGHLICRLGLRMTVEDAAPCGDGDQSLVFGEQCMSVTTEALSSTIEQANATASVISTEPADGESLSCPALAGGTSGMTLIGAVPMTDRQIGDLIGIVRVPCN